MSSRDEAGTPPEPEPPEAGEAPREETPPPVLPEESATPPHGDPLGRHARPEDAGD
jgi:hypothetical protein